MASRGLLLSLVFLQIVLAILAQSRFVVNDIHVDSYELIVGGSFNHVLEGGQVPDKQPELINIASYGYSAFFNYGNWTNLAEGLPEMQAVSAVASHVADAGATRVVFAAGKVATNVTGAEPVSYIAQFSAPWNPSNSGMELYKGAWSSVVKKPTPVTGYTYNGLINNLYITSNFTTNVNDSTAGSNYILYVAGTFTTMTNTNGGVSAVGSLARYDSNNTVWSNMLGGVSNVNGIARVTDVVAASSSNTSVIVVGSFTHAGAIPANNVAHYFCSSDSMCEWRSLGANQVVGTVNGARVITKGNDTLLYIGGDFVVDGVANSTNAAVFNFTTNQWAGLNSGIVGSGAAVYAMDVDEYCIYFGGRFVINNTLTSQDGDLGPATNIACWGILEQNWIALGDGLDGAVKKIRAGAIYSGPEIVFEKRVYVAGNFSNSGTTPMQGLAYFVDRGYGPFDGAWVDVHTGTAINLYAFIVLGAITALSTVFGIGYCIWSYKKKRDSAAYQTVA